ncbi:MAG: carbohydrate ABC transporter permease [Chloroflexi bacterium]|nr:carbohydrate ABC transporter permease [Chloroflexota bacterium]
MKRSQLVLRILTHAFLITTSFIMVYPVLFMVLGAFTTNRRFLETVVLPIPNTLNLDMFQRALQSGISESYIFTLMRAGFYIVVTLAVGLICGYIFSKLNFPGKDKVFILLLTGMLLPGILMLIPTYLMMSWWPNAGGNNWLGQGGHGLIGSWAVLFIGGWVPPFAIFVMRQSFDMLPTEYQDAAKMDGAGIFTIIFRVYGPMLKPPIVALTILVFVANWNDYLWPALTVGGFPELYPIAVRMQYVIIADYSPLGEINYPAVMVKTFLATWPPAALYFLLQRYFVQGLVSSGLKG